MTLIEDAELAVKAMKVIKLWRIANTAIADIIERAYPGLDTDQKIVLMVECEKLYIQERFYL